jgi:hypothetical protein
MNYQKFVELKRNLHSNLVSGCEKAVEIIKEDVPIDTQRLFESTRVDDSEFNESSDDLQVNLVAGGIELYGVRREQSILKEVDYAIFLERRDGFMYEKIQRITDAIVEEFES